MNVQKNHSTAQFFLKILQGSFIGLGAVLPGISGGVLCVVFGIYKPVMELLSDPFRKLKTHIPLLFPVILGAALGFLGIANLLAVLLERYPNPCICLFVGLITGMLPSLFREANERGKNEKSFWALFGGMTVVFALLVGLKLFQIQILPGFLPYLFCGCCLALSILVPGMSFSTLLMPLGLYEPFVSGIGSLDMAILLPAGAGAVITVILLARAINRLFERHYTLAFHAIIGIVIAATVMIIPFKGFTHSFAQTIINLLCLISGIGGSILLDHFNRSYEERAKP